MNEDNNTPMGSPVPSEPDRDPDLEAETRRWAMFLHFSVLAAALTPMAGVLAPVIIWQLKKQELPGIVPHANVVLNWLVSYVIYFAICLLLMVTVVLLPLAILGLVALSLATLVLSIVGGIKANEGELWEYPGTIVRPFK